MTARLRVGVIGLGAGTLAAYGRPGDDYRFYEIDADVVAIAGRYFRYLSDSKAATGIVLGDARLSLEREPAQDFDVLAVDAFSGDAIPVHLMTREALQVMLRHVKPEGAIAFHVTNRNLDLAPVVAMLATEAGYEAILIAHRPAQPGPMSRSDWVIVTRSRALLDDALIASRRSEIAPIPGLEPWSDDFNNLLPVVRASALVRLFTSALRPPPASP